MKYLSCLTGATWPSSIHHNKLVLFISAQGLCLQAPCSGTGIHGQGNELHQRALPCDKPRTERAAVRNVAAHSTRHPPDRWLWAGFGYHFLTKGISWHSSPRSILSGSLLVRDLLCLSSELIHRDSGSHSTITLYTVILNDDNSNSQWTFMTKRKKIKLSLLLQQVLLQDTHQSTPNTFT